MYNSDDTQIYRSVASWKRVSCDNSAVPTLSFPIQNSIVMLCWGQTGSVRHTEPSSVCIIYTCLSLMLAVHQTLDCTSADTLKAPICDACRPSLVPAYTVALLRLNIKPSSVPLLTT